MKQRKIKVGDVVRVVKNNGSPFFDRYIGEVGVVAFESDPGEYALEEFEGLTFVTNELELVDPDDKVGAMLEEVFEDVLMN